MTYASDIMEAPTRSLPILSLGRKIRFGTIGLGLDLPRAIWPQENQVFSLQDPNLYQTALEDKKGNPLSNNPGAS